MGTASEGPETFDLALERSTDRWWYVARERKGAGGW
jgi:hypothetical protein